VDQARKALSRIRGSLALERLLANNASMPCLIGCLALLFPRVVIVLLFVFTGYLQRAFANVSLLWPVLGFIFLPVTTLAYALAMNANNGQVSGLYLVLVILAVLFDLGLLGGGGSQGRKYRNYYRH
jgi:hypothetical protein